MGLIALEAIMTPARTCAKCGATLSAESVLDVCPHCVAAQVLSTDTSPVSADASAKPPGTILMGSADPVEQPGDRIGRYKLLQKLGEGGCGVVYMAEQEEPVRRRVALKVIKLGMDTKSVIARFEAERQALAMMDHPNIAKVLDAGATDQGRPYFVMELVRGIKITDYCDQNHLPTAARLELFSKVCSAIQHAHQKGIIHRDIKPSNILVTLHDGVPVPKVIDFGIAKATTDQRLTDKTLFTAFEQFIGTPAYMSPEQAEMSGLDIDTRTDIYALGVLLYELLTGKTPFDPKELLAVGLDEMRRTIREVEPVKPSTRLTQQLAATGVSRLQNPSADPSSNPNLQHLKELIHLLRGDLDWIVMRCLEKDRTRRYETANGIAADIQRHLRNEPVVARPPSAVYKLQKAIRRNKAAFAAGAAVTMALVIGLGFSTWQSIEKSQALRRTQEAEQEQSRLRRQAQVSEQTATAEASRAAASADESRHRLRRLQVANGARLLEEGNLMHALPWFVEAFKTDQGHPENEAHHRLRIASTFERCPRPRQMWFLNAEVPSVSFSADGRRVLAAAQDGTAAIWDADTGQQLGLARSAPLTSGAVVRTGFAANGARAFVEGRDTVVVFDVLTMSAPSRIIQVGEGIGWTELSLDGRFLVTSGAKHHLVIWDAGTGERLRELADEPSEPHRFAFITSDNARSLFGPEPAVPGHAFITASSDGLIRARDAETGKLFHERALQEFPDSSFMARGRFSQDGRLLVHCNI
jgi:serine/threonine protein kinase